MAASHHHLALDRSKSNNAFASWRLANQPDADAAPDVVQLPHDVASIVPKDTDYVHTRIAALHNHMIELPSGRYCFLAGPQGLELHSVGDDGSLSKLYGGQAAPRHCFHRAA